MTKRRAALWVVGGLLVGLVALATTPSMPQGPGESRLWTSDLYPVTVSQRVQDKAAFGELRVAQDTPEVNLLFSNNVNPALVETITTVGAATLTQADGMMVLQTGTTSTGELKAASVTSAQYLPGQGLLARFTSVFTPCVANSRQEIGLLNPATDDAAMFGCVGAVFGIIHRTGASETFIPQTSWSEDKMDGSGYSRVLLDITTGTIFAVQMQYLGFGPIRYYSNNPKTGEFVLVHVESWGGGTPSGGGGKATPSFTNPTFGLGARVANAGNTTNLTLSTASMSLAREGEDGHSGPIGGAVNRKTGISTLSSILAVKVKTTFGSGALPSEVRIRLRGISYYSVADGYVQLVLNPTLGGSPSYADFSTNTSVVQIDTAGTTVTGGRVIYSGVSNSTPAREDLWTQHIELNPGDVLAFAAVPFSGNTTIGAAINWYEEF